MEKAKVIQKLKKYFFLISILLFGMTSIHLVYTYMYSDATEEPIVGGTISAWLIGQIPHFNPLVNSSGHDKYIISILYRSLLTYDVDQEKIVSDIATCDISNLLYIECFLNDNVYWSDGSRITSRDIIATYEILKNSSVNPIVASLLKETTIEERASSIIFSNRVKDINFLNVFFQPIAPASILETLGSEELQGKFSPLSGIYSWKYIINNISQDEAVGVTRLTLEKNMNYHQNPVFIEKIIFKFFKDAPTFLKQKEGVNIFHDKQNLIWESIARLQEYTYHLPQYISLFVNYENIPDSSLRTFILSQIHRDELIKTIGAEDYHAVLNPYISDISIDIPPEQTLQDILSRLGYTPLKNHIEKVRSKISTKTSAEYSGEAKPTETSTTTTNSTGSVATENTPISKENLQAPSLTIISPDFVETYNYITKDDILLQGTASGAPDAIYVNDYKLQGYTKGDPYFYYRLRESYNTISPGINTYDISFESGGKKEIKETIIFLYDTDTAKLERLKADFFAKLEQEWEKKLAEEQALQEAQEATTISKSEEEKFKEELQTLESLDGRWFYNDDLEPFTLKLFYFDTEKNITDASSYIQKTLEKLGIQVELSAVSITDVIRMLQDDTETAPYDLMLGGVHLQYFDFNIFPYFHSSQIKWGNHYNFSRYRKLSLDILLEELRGNILSKEKTLELENKVLEILKEEQIVKTLYSPNMSILIDKNIKNITIPENLPDESYRILPIENAYLLERKNLITENKTFFGFFGFIFEHLFLWTSK